MLRKKSFSSFLKKKKFKIIVSRIVSYVKYSSYFHRNFCRIEEMCVSIVCRLPRFQECYPSRIILLHRASPLLHPGFLSGRLASKATIRYANEGMSARFSLRFALSSHPTSLSTFTRWATSIENVRQCTEDRNLIDPERTCLQEFFFLFFFFFFPYRALINLIRSNYQCCELLPHCFLSKQCFLFFFPFFFTWNCQPIRFIELSSSGKVFQAKYLSILCTIVCYQSSLFRIQEVSFELLFPL